MHGTRASSVALAREVAKFAAQTQTPHEIILCPPFPLLAEVEKALRGTFIKLGAQDCHEQPEGAFTGSVSAAMLRETSCEYVIIGHSERREGLHETNELVRAKAAQAQANGLIPIICVGETQAQREAGQAKAVISQQLRESLPPINHQPPTTNHFLLAYEPIWAIGSGKIPTTHDIADMHAHILSLHPGAKLLYGGSVKAANAAEIMAIEGVSGVLVGGASLKAEEFCGIIGCLDD